MYAKFGPFTQGYCCIRRLCGHSWGMKFMWKFWYVFAVVVLLGAHHAQAQAQAADLLEIKTASGSYIFRVEVAATPEDRSTGLMFRKDLGAREGMLFVYKPPNLMAMWMKNTLIPLDMLFIDLHGYVVKIAQNTVPLSRTPISSDFPVTMVLEVPGGTAQALGIQIRDQVSVLDGS